MEKRPDVPSVRVTYFYLKLLMDGFVFHASSGPGQSLGKSINLEGGEQVSAKRIKKIINILRDFDICSRVILNMAKSEHSGSPIYLEAAFAKVSEEFYREGFKVSPEVIGRAYKRYGSQVAAAMEELLIGDATS
jgi:hypothetical protein